MYTSFLLPIRRVLIRQSNSPLVLKASFAMAPKRKASALAAGKNGPAKTNVEIPLPNGPTYNASEQMPPPPKRPRASRQGSKASVTNPDDNSQVMDAPGALRASPDAAEREELPLSDVPDDVVEKPEPKKRGAKKAAAKSAKEEKEADAVVPPKKPKPGVEALADPEAEGEEEADEEEIKEAMLRPPPVNSDYLPLPWKGRLGYVSRCIDTSCCLLTRSRLVCAHICAIQTHQSSAHEHAESPPSSNTAILSKTRRSPNIRPKIDQTRRSPRISRSGRNGSNNLAWPMPAISPR